MYFQTVPLALFELVTASLVIDDLMEIVETLALESGLVAGMYWCFVVLTGIPVSSMLVGVRCNVATLVATVEREEHAETKRVFLWKFGQLC